MRLKIEGCVNIYGGKGTLKNETNQRSEFLILIHAEVEFRPKILKMTMMNTLKYHRTKSTMVT